MSDQVLRDWERKIYPGVSARGAEWHQRLDSLRAEVIAGEADVKRAKARLLDARCGAEAASNRYKAMLAETLTPLAEGRVE